MRRLYIYTHTHTLVGSIISTRPFGTAPTLSNLLLPLYTPSRGIRSSADRRTLTISRSSFNTSGQRSFSHASYSFSTWSDLPYSPSSPLRVSNTLSQALKSHSLFIRSSILSFALTIFVVVFPCILRPIHSPFLPPFLPSFLVSFLPSFLPSFLSSLFPSFLPFFLLSFFPSFIRPLNDAVTEGSVFPSAGSRRKLQDSANSVTFHTHRQAHGEKTLS